MDRPWPKDEGQVRELLLVLARPDTTERELQVLAASVDIDATVGAAQHHHVVSLVHDRLRATPGVSSDTLTTLGRGRLAAQAQRHLLQRALLAALHALDVPALVMKGHVLAADWYRDPMTRDFNDNDILVRPAHMTRAVEALESAGFASAATNWHGFLELEVGEVPMRKQTTVIDLHWHVVATGRPRRHLELPTGEFFERAVVTRVGDTEVRTLHPTDTLLHLCVNSGLGGGRRLRGLLDIDAVLRSGRVDLEEFIERARSTGAARLCSAMIQRTHSALGTPVPHNLLVDLAPSRLWLRANRLVDRVGPHRRNPTAGVAPGWLLSSGRRSATSTALAAVRSVGEAIAARNGRPRPTDPDGVLAWTRVPDDGDIEGHRARYFDWVATQA